MTSRGISRLAEKKTRRMYLLQRTNKLGEVGEIGATHKIPNTIKTYNQELKIRFLRTLPAPPSSNSFLIFMNSKRTNK